MSISQVSNEPSHGLNERERAARRYVEQLRVFYVHAAVFAGGMVIIFAVNLATNLTAGIAGEWSSWWSVWSFIGWGLGIAVHGLVVRLQRPNRQITSWEQQQIESVGEMRAKQCGPPLGILALRAACCAGLVGAELSAGAGPPPAG